ncbi:MAG: DUF6686 family protein [Flavobacteriales bacterium]
MHDEANESLLHHTEEGFVHYCSCCEHFQVGFGNAIMVLPREGFCELHQQLSGIDPFKIPEEVLPNGRTHLIKSSCQSFMALNEEEISELQELLDGAEAAFQVETLLKEG